MRVALDYEKGDFCCLLDLPELMNHIIEYLDAITLCLNFQCASKYLYQMANECGVWLKLCIASNFVTRFPEVKSYKANDTNDYKKIYIICERESAS